MRHGHPFGAGETPSPFEPDVLLPEQCFPGPGHAIERESLLMLAILEDALQCYQQNARARDPRARQAFAEAADWLASSDRSWLFSFESICDALEIDADALRHALRERSLRREAPGRRHRAPERSIDAAAAGG